MDDGGGEGVEDGVFVDCFVLGLGGALGAGCRARFAECVFYGFIGCEECASCLSPVSISTYVHPMVYTAVVYAQRKRPYKRVSSTTPHSKHPDTRP